MDFNTVIAAIGSLGFPIVACILMCYMFLKFTDNIKSITEIVSNNTAALNRLIDKLDDDKGRKDNE